MVRDPTYNDNLGNLPRRLIEDEIEVILTQERVGGVRCARIVEYLGNAFVKGTY